MKIAFALTSVLLLASCVSIQKVDREANRAVFKAHIKDVESCYVPRLKEKPDLEGKLVLEFDVRPGGVPDSVHFVEESSTLKDDVMRECILAKVPSWKFPEPPDGQMLVMSYPYFFSAHTGGAVQLGNRPQTK